MIAILYQSLLLCNDFLYLRMIQRAVVSMGGIAQYLCVCLCGCLCVCMSVYVSEIEQVCEREREAGG